MWKECESYKHKCAKEIVKGWIDSELEIPTNYETNSSVYKLGSQSRNRDEVWLEYPVGYYKENDYNSINILFDEQWDECGVWTNNNPVPTYQQCMKNNFNVVAVLDIAVQHKGSIFQGIEICHKNPVSDKKVQKLKEIGLNELVEIDADWVLNQIGIPKEIKIKRFLI